jgi:hypothetical protein
MTVDDDRVIASLSDEELTLCVKQRSQLRIKYPGISSYFFELVLEIVIEEIIGWDLTEGQPREDIVGLFRIPQAFTALVEEQGRKTLHTHIQIWVQNNECRECCIHHHGVFREKLQRVLVTAWTKLAAVRFFLSTIIVVLPIKSPQPCHISVQPM